MWLYLWWHKRYTCYKAGPEEAAEGVPLACCISLMNKLPGNTFPCCAKRIEPDVSTLVV